MRRALQLVMPSPARAIRWLPAVAVVAALGTGAAHAETGLACAQGPCSVADYDGDTVKDWADNCPLNGNRKQQDNDKDTGAPVVDVGMPPEPIDNTTGPIRIYPATPLQTGQPLPTDRSREQGGDSCDLDDDNDGIYDRRSPGKRGPDNCQMVPNPDQGDADRDGIGDRCDKEFNPPAIAKVTHPKKLPARRYDEIGAGLIVPLRCSSACSVSGALTVGKTVIGRGTAALDGAGRTFLIVRIPAKSLSNLRRKRARIRPLLKVTTVGEATPRTVMKTRVLLHP
jgi:Thrombospondin type 3 repeat